MDEAQKALQREELAPALQLLRLVEQDEEARRRIEDRDTDPYLAAYNSLEQFTCEMAEALEASQREVTLLKDATDRMQRQFSEIETLWRNAVFLNKHLQAILERRDEALLREELAHALVALKLSDQELEEARGLVRELLPTCRGEDPHSVRWHEKMRERYPWLKEE